MDRSPQDAVARAQEQQRNWYGEPLGDLFRRLIADLGLNQARLAGILGLSAPMLSQLMSGQRAKIGNPAVVQRVQSLQELAACLADGQATAAQAAERMQEIRQSAGSSVLGATTHTSLSIRVDTDGRAVRDVVELIRALLRNVASAEEITRAADSLAAGHPHLAEFLRVYGSEHGDEAVAHFRAHRN